MRRLTVFLAPALLVLGLVCAPLLTGTRTLLLRDVLNTHLGLRAYLGEALRQGEIPLVDPLRSGGQPLTGNPNAMVFYPDNLLLLVGSTLWQLNFHFALHWIAAFAAAFWLGRAWGLRREGAAGVATVYALSGYLYSQLNLYNGIAEAAIAPALWAALLELGEPTTRRRATLALGALWALVIVGGDPPVGGLALAAGLLLAAARHGRRLPWRRLGAALLCGTLLAAPQIVETARILGESYRGFWGYLDMRAGARDPLALFDLLVPLFFGRPDLGTTWGASLFGGFPPLYFTLFPGLVSMALALAAGRPRRRESIALAAVGTLLLVLTFSGGTLIERLLQALPGSSLVRFPEKLFVVPALALAVAAGSGVDRLLEAGGGRRLARASGLLALPVLALWLGLGGGGGWVERGFSALFGAALDPQVWSGQRLRWAGLEMFVLMTLIAVMVSALWSNRRPVAAAVLVLSVHALSQAFFLAPLAVTDSAARYRKSPPLADQIPLDLVLAHGGALNLFGPGYFEDPPAESEEWPPVVAIERRAHDELIGFAGRLEGRRYELDMAPDGFDQFVGHVVAVGMRGFSDRRRIAILAATGVDRLLLHRALDPPEAGGARQILEIPSSGRSLHVYAIPDALPDAVMAGRAVFAPDVNAALEAVWSERFDPRSEAVVAGSRAPLRGPPGSARVLAREAERLEIAVSAPAGGYLVVRRAYLPIWRAAVDGAPARAVVADLTRLAVEVPAGEHRVTFRISRLPLRLAFLVALVGLIGLLVLARGARNPAPRAPESLC